MSGGGGVVDGRVAGGAVEELDAQIRRLEIVLERLRRLRDRVAGAV